ncbi:helix-turn-helix transcriptional regulator [Actinomyces trachealis]|uniref:helix-turn-helix transcriptional regulator n=1 Tax=Actinomyces trachealis TaxID=2763540 RepID=UPI001892B0B9|nr:helix-turn-helix transcriptional regulator [Actinomyces trachealis]
MKIEIAKRLYCYRTTAGLSQEQVAARIGVSRQAVSKWECAESSPDTDNLIALALLYQVTVDELLFADPEQNLSARSAVGAEGQAESPDGETEAPAGPGDYPSSRWVSCDGDPDYVNVSFDDGIHVRDIKKGEEVHVGWDGIHVDTPTDHVHLDFAGLARAIRELRKRQR